MNYFNLQGYCNLDTFSTDYYNLYCLSNMYTVTSDCKLEQEFEHLLFLLRRYTAASRRWFPVSLPKTSAIGRSMLQVRGLQKIIDPSIDPTMFHTPYTQLVQSGPTMLLTPPQPVPNPLVAVTTSWLPWTCRLQYKSYKQHLNFSNEVPDRCDHSPSLQAEWKILYTRNM